MMNWMDMLNVNTVEDIMKKRRVDLIHAFGKELG